MRRSTIAPLLDIVRDRVAVSFRMYAALSHNHTHYRSVDVNRYNATPTSARRGENPLLVIEVSSQPAQCDQ